MNSAFLNFLIVIIGILILSFILDATPKDFYKRGQIDALTGNVKYELVIQDNGETVWKRKQYIKNSH